MGSKYNFDKIIDRRHIDSYKWNVKDNEYSFSIADMDFDVMLEIKEAIIKQANISTYGYTYVNDKYYEAYIKWWKSRYDTTLKKDWFMFYISVVASIDSVIKRLTKINDGISLFSPNYNVFYNCINNNHRNVIEIPFDYKDYKYSINWDLVEQGISKSKMFILCNPHNPVGRVWTREELLIVGDICLRNNMTIVCDEIHADFVYSGHKHIPIASLSDELKKITVTCTSATKSFNIAGIQAANIVISDDSMRRAVDKYSLTTGAYGLNIMGLVATRAAYTYGDKWMDELNVYLESNLLLVKSRLAGTKLKVTDTEGTYLVWIDATELGVEDPYKFFLNRAHIRFSDGLFFSKKASQFIRMNIACPRSVVSEALDRVLKIPEIM